jgi:hypothetical protein
MSNSDSQKFVLDFFNKIDNILEEKKGGKRKTRININKNRNKKQKGSGKDGELDLPVPLNDKSIFDVIQLQETIQSSPSLETSIKIEILPPKNISDNDVAAEFSNHIKFILENIQNKPAIEMSPEELQILSLFINYNKLKTDTVSASSTALSTLSQTKQLPQEQKVVIEDGNSEENLQLVSTLLKNVSGPSDLVDKQVESMENITENAVKDITTLSNLYESKASAEEISSASTSSFLNLFGYLSFLFSLLVCYKNRINEYGTTLKTKNPIIYFIMSSIYSCISFVLFLIFKLFMFLINTKIGKIYLLFVFLKLYRENNVIAVFVANTIIKLISIADKGLGASAHVNMCIEKAKQILIDNIPNLLTNDSIKSLLTSVISTALINPTVLANFISSLSPELSSQIIQQALPAITQGLTDSISHATPQMIQALTQGVASQVGPQIVGAITEGTASLASELGPALIEGITHGISSNVGTMITDVATNAVTTAVTEVGKNMAQQQLTSSIVTTASKTALTLVAQGVSYYLTGDTSAANLLTNSGGKRTRKNKKSKRTKKPKKHVKRSKTYKK